MANIYACLCGKWVNLTLSNATVGAGKPVNTWWKEENNDLFKYDYINIQYNGKNYRIHPSFIQVVTE
jgi:hypothetical protein